MTDFSELTRKHGLLFRDGMRDWDHVCSNLVFSGTVTGTPLVTIAVPTYKRDEMLVESLHSALDQQQSRPTEIIVVDNDPASTRIETLLEQLPELRNAHFRYYVNSEDIGWIGNFNRCIDLARGEWITILNDDDLLKPGFIQQIFQTLDKRPDIHGVGSRKSTFWGSPEMAPQPRSGPRRVAARALTELLWKGQSVRRIPPAKFFWGPLLGNVVGFIFRKSKATTIGGFYLEDSPSDSIFLTRFAAEFGLWQHRVSGAAIRVEQNQSIAQGGAMIRNLLARDAALRAQLAEGSRIPLKRALLPFVVNRHRVEIRALLGIDISKGEAEAMLGYQLPGDRPMLYRLMRLLLRGF